MFTPEELAEMAAADAEIDTEFRLTQEDLERSRELDREAKFCALPMKKQKVAEYQKAYREANREKVAAQQKAYREANREKAAEYQKAYREANREKVRERARNYMREYRAKKENRRRCWHTNDGKEIVRHPYYMGQERNRQDGFETDGSGDPEF